MRYKQLLLTLLSFVCLQTWADNISLTYSYTFEKKTFGDAETRSLGGVNWTLTINESNDDETFFGYDGTKGQHIGSAAHYVSSMTLSTTEIPGTITSVKVNSSGASDTNATMGISVGGTNFTSGGNQTVSLTSTATVYTFTSSATGEIQIQYNQTSQKAIYIKSIEVEYSVPVAAPTLTSAFTFWQKTTETDPASFTITPSAGTTVRYTTDGTTASLTNGTEITETTTVPLNATTTVSAIGYIGESKSDVVSTTYTLGQTVNSVAEFKVLANNTEARLYLNADNNARITYNKNSEAYLRDNTGAICLYNITPSRNFAYNQHIAGWIIGKKTSYYGLPEMAATENTTTDYLVIADKVSESDVEPKAIAAANYDENLADWVKVTDLVMGTSDIVAYNKFSLTSSDYYQAPYSGARYDIIGIAVPYNSAKQIAPIYQNSIRPLVYVIDENEEFASPTSNISNATVRLVRTLSSEWWNTFTVPFDITFDETEIREYDHASGNTMVYASAESVEAGKPYLLKPTTSIVNPTFTDVTLKTTAAQTITDGNYSFKAIYKPTTLKTDGTEYFLGDNDELYYPSSESASTIKGMRAYFIIPSGNGARVSIDGVEEEEQTDGIDGLPWNKDSQLRVYSTSGQYLGNSLNGLPRGMYIVNGKKVIIK